MNLLLPGIASAYLITFARVGTLIMLMPGVGEQMVSPRMRLAFALLTTLVLFLVMTPYAALAARARHVLRRPAILARLNRGAALILGGAAIWSLVRRA